MASKDDEWEDVPENDGEWEDIDSPQNKEANFWEGVDEDYEARRPGILKSAASGFLQGGARNWGDEAIAGVATAMGKGSYEDNKLKARMDMYRAQQENPKTFGASEFAGMLSTSPATMNPYTAAGIAGAEGVTRSLGSSDRITPGDIGRAGATGAIDAATAGAFTKYGPKAFDALARGAKPVADYAKGVAGRQAVKALRPTQGMMKQLNEKGLTEDVGNFALDNNIVNAYRSNKGMNNKAQEITQGFANETKPIYEASKNSKVSSDDLKSEIQNRIDALAQDPGKKPIIKKLQGYLSDIDDAAAAGKVEYNPSDIRSFRKDIQDTINYNSKPTKQMGAREMRAMLRDQEMGLIEKVDPKLKAQNEGLFRNIRLGNEVEKIAERGEAQSGANNLFGLNSGIMGSAAGAATYAATGDPTAAAFATGGVGIGRELVRRYGNQMAASAIRKIANIAEGKTFGPLFQAALAKGGSAVPLLHEKLLSSDPEYRRQFESGK